MEFPQLGDHCAVTTCSQLDFLPFTCDACGKIFCKDHREYEKHNCEEAYSKDVTVPVCPLCNQPVPTRRGNDPNVSVDEHIANDCQSDKAKKVYSNKCRYPGCKKKELVPVICENCGKNYCIRHRLGPDHDCVVSTSTANKTAGRNTSSIAQPQASRRTSNKAPQATFMSHSGAEMHRLHLERRQPQQQNVSNYSQLQGMSEDEALAMAMAASLGQKGPQQSSSSNQSAGASGYDEDEALARAMAASLQEEDKEKHKRQSQRHRQPQQRQQKKSDGESCNIS